MNTYYIPVHFYEQEPRNDGLVMLVTQNDIDESELEKQLLKCKNRYLKRQDEFSDIDEMVDAIFNELAKKINAVWCYCEKLPQLVIGDPGEENADD